MSLKPRNEEAMLKLVRKETNKLNLPPVNKATLLSEYHKLAKKQPELKSEKMEKFLVKRAVRTLSGVTVISVLTKPLPCPGKCLYCPTEKDMPKSYLSNEPAVMRAILNKFDPCKQIRMRIQALEANGHNTEKIELIVMGGTWSCHPSKYQKWFLKRCFEALNGKMAGALEHAQEQNETAFHRCIGLTLETRPDYINKKEIERLRDFGCTRVELGIQHTDDQVLKLNKRGHKAKESVEAVKLLKQAGFKINFHVMLNLPGSTPKKDLEMFKTLYSSPDWRPDMVKIYPCVVNKFSPLFRLWKEGRYKPYSSKQLLNLIIAIKKITPPWVRISRLIRDIPAESIVAGNKITNLRQIIQQKMGSCRCIRCREAKDRKAGKIKFVMDKYRASEGTEYFLSFTSLDEKILSAFLRLRIDDDLKKDLPELNGAALIRELHTCGQAVSLGRTGKIQHLGLGKKLLLEAESVCKKENVGKIAVISGIGVRKYYEKTGYFLEGTYMVKNLKKR